MLTSERRASGLTSGVLSGTSHSSPAASHARLVVELELLGSQDMDPGPQQVLLKRERRGLAGN